MRSDTVQRALVELVSAMSALNMPTPEECPPEMVRHAYEHLEAAVSLLGESAPPDQDQETVSFLKWTRTIGIKCPQQFQGWRVGMLREDEFEREALKLGAELRKDFSNVPLTDAVRHSIRSIVVYRLTHWQNIGLIVPPDTPNTVPISWY